MFIPVVLKSLVAQMVNLYITHNGSSNIALNYSICIFKLNYEPPEWKKNKNASSFELTF